MNAKVRTLSSCLVAAVVATGAGCSSEAESEEKAPLLDGVFRLSSFDPSASIRELELRGDRYWLVPAECPDPSCEEHGVFEVDRARDRIELAPEGAAPYALPFGVLSIEQRATSVETGASPANALADTQEKLVSTPGELTTSATPLVSSIKLVDYEYTLLETQRDECGNRDFTRIASAVCLGNRERFRSARCIQMNDRNNCNAANKGSCLQDTADNDARTRFDRAVASCWGSNGVARETVGDANNGLNPFVMQVCCEKPTCPGGVRSDGTSVTGSLFQEVCGTNGRMWRCGRPDSGELDGRWQDTGRACQ